MAAPARPGPAQSGTCPLAISVENIFALKLTFYKWARRLARSHLLLPTRLRLIAIKYLNAHSFFLNAHRSVKCENYAYFSSSFFFLV